MKQQFMKKTNLFMKIMYKISYNQSVYVKKLIFKIRKVVILRVTVVIAQTENVNICEKFTRM